MTDPIITVEGLSKLFARDLRTARRRGIYNILGELSPRLLTRKTELAPDEFWSLDDVSFTLARGETLGIVGSNGAGKSTLLRILHGLSKPDRGLVEVGGKTAAVLQLGASFDMQLTGRESIALEAPLHGLDAGFTSEQLEQILDFAEIGDFIDAPVRTYSMGMRLRLAYAITAALDADILLLDEDLAVGDFGFQRKCVRFLKRFVAGGGSIIVVSHQLWELSNICDTCLVLDHGRVISDGDLNESLQVYISMSEEREYERLAREAAFHQELKRADEAMSDRARQSKNSIDGSDLMDAQYPVTVVDATLRSQSGGPAIQHQPAIVTVEVDVQERLDHFSWGFAITQPGQLAVIVSGEAPTQTGIGCGRHYLTADIVSWPLYAQSYELRVVVVDPDGALIGQGGLFGAPFRVEPANLGTKRETHARMVRAMADLSLDWTSVEPSSTPEVSTDP